MNKKKEKKEPIIYICPFCKKERRGGYQYSKTEINYRGKWIQGCPDCFTKSIDDIKNFNETEYDL